MKFITRSLFLICSILLLSLPGTGMDLQDPDSLLRVYRIQHADSAKVHTLHALFNWYLYNDPAKAKNYAAEQLQLSKDINYQKGIAQADYNFGVYYSNTNQIDSAKLFYQTALDIYRDLGHFESQGKVNYGLAILEYATGNYDQALQILDSNIYIFGTLLLDSLPLGGEFHLKGMVQSRKGNYRIALRETLTALKILEKSDDPLRLADSYNALAAIESYLENFEKSIDYNLQALKIYQAKNDKMFEAQALNDIGNSYYYLEDHTRAVDYLHKSLALSREMNSVDLEATALTNLGKTYTALRQYDLAIDNLLQSITLAEQSKNPIKVVEALNGLGKVYNAINEPERAITYFSSAIALSDSIGSKESLRTGYFNRSASYEKLHRYDRALQDNKRFASLSDTLLNTTKSKQIEELRAIFDMEKKEQEIALQKNEIALLGQKAKVSNLQKTMLIAGLISLSLFVGFAYYGLRQKIQRTRLEKEKTDADLAFKVKELTTHALHLAKKNETLEHLKQTALELKNAENGSQGYQQLIRTINSDLQDDKGWNNFSRYFEEVHKDFNATVANKYPDVTPNEYRLMALIKMNLSSKEIAIILNISIPGIKKARQRLRKKMNLQTEESLENAVLSI